MTQCVSRGETCSTLGLNVQNIQGDKAFKKGTDWKLLNILKLDHRQENSDLFITSDFFFLLYIYQLTNRHKTARMITSWQLYIQFLLLCIQTFSFLGKASDYYRLDSHPQARTCFKNKGGALIKTLLVPNLTSTCNLSKYGIHSKKTAWIKHCHNFTEKNNKRREEKGQVKRVGKKKNVRIVPFLFISGYIITTEHKFSTK